MICRNGEQSAGFTVVELLVSIAVLGLLVALLLPGVQQSRESARRIQCRNNLKQFGVALASFQSTHGVYPTGTLNNREPAMWRLLPALGFPAMRDDLLAFRFSIGPGSRLPKCELPIFRCPSDTLHTSANGESNYLLNDGTEFRNYERTNGFRQSLHSDTKPSDVTDGLSQTAAMAEHLVALPHLPEAEMIRDPKRYLWFTQTRHSLANETLLAVLECRENRTTPFPQFIRVGMIYYDDSRMGYDHLMQPNEIGCYNGPEDFQSMNNWYLIPANSQHPGGVHVLLLDGSVHFATDHIDENVWRATGTIGDHEPVSTQF
ncbi:MAG: DUF1559 domain-containing protein [Planctomycetota bacterium]|nr:MAG: DUF1559 domain-containing protein [Planctomycetota bacterium]